MHVNRILGSLFAGLIVSAAVTAAGGVGAESSAPIKVGVIGLDTSHAVAFTQAFNNPKAAGDLADMTVVAALPWGVPDNPASTTRIEGYTQALRKMGVQIVDSVDELLENVDAVLIERIPTAREAQTLVAALREQGFAEPVVLGESEPLAVRVGPPLPLRGAVQVAERLRAGGHPVRVAAQPGEAATFAVRHGNFATADEAAATARELARLGVPSQIVRAR